MKIKTLILTFFMMMSSPFLFGQHWVDPTLPGEDVMTVTAKVTLDGKLQSGESYEVAVFNANDNKLVEVGTFTNHGIPELEYHVGLTIPGGEGDKFYFKFFNGINEYVSLTEIDYADEQGSHLNLFTIEFKSVASLNNVIYSSLQDAIDAAANEDVITLLKKNAENVTVVQAPNVAFTIDGADNTMTGTITVNGKSAAYPTAGLTIKNVNFDVTNIADASIMLGVSNNTNTRYTNGVTVQNCTFTGNDQTKVAIKNYTGGCKNITVSGGTFTGLHSLMQVKGVDGIEVSGVTVENCKNGIAVGTSTNVAISGSTISATGYGVRADGEGAYTMTLTNNTISAELPVVVRKATGNYNLNIEGDNNSYTASNENAYQVVFTNGDDGTYEAPEGIFTLNIAEGTDLNVYPVYVAKIGNRGYMTIEAAIDAAQAGETVTILPGTYNQPITIDKAGIAVRGAYPVMLENAGLIITADGVTVSDIQVNNPGGKAVQINAKDILIEYCDLAGANGLYQSYTSGTVTFSNSYIGGGTYGIHFDGSANGNIVIEDCTIAGWTSFASSIDHVTITNTTFDNASNNQLRFYQDATVEDVKFPAGMRVDTGSGGTGMENVTLTFNDCEVAEGGNLEDVFPGSVIVKSDIYVDGELLSRVAQIEDEYYKTLQDAIDAATEGQTVTVIANIELENTVTVAAGKVVTLDLNGNVVSGVCNSSQAHLFMVQNTAELTVKDSSENQEGKITYARGTSGTGWAIDLEGELVLESGTIELTGESWSIGYVVDIRPNSWGTEYTEATTFTMKGGKLVSSFDAIRIASTSADGSQANGVVHENVSANFVMNGGEIVSNRDAIFVQQSNTVYDILNLQVNDGKISGAQSLIRLYGPAATSVVNNVENPITLDINGGTFDYTGNNLEDTRWLVPGVIMVAGGATFDQMLDYTNFEITGGTFDGDVSAYCAFGYTCQANGDGTYGVVETEGFEIPNLDRLIAFRNAVNAGNTFEGQTVTVTADISMGDVENWTPIGTSEHAFQGTFDGGNFTISNLKIDAPETSNVGLFGVINNNATIKNLTIDNATINAKSNVGAIVGNLHSSTMDNCHVTGSVQINGNYKVGGLVGTAYSSVRNSSLVADDYSYVKGTYSTANFEGDNVGGITGYNGEGVYTYSNNTVKNVTISGTRKVGGILGFIFEDAKVEGSVVENVTIESTATNEYAQENAGKMSIGGIIGQYQTHGSNNGYVNSSVVKNVTFVKGENQDFQVGPLVGGTRNNANFVPSATVTSKDNHVYMSTITGSNNLFLMHAVAQIGETEYYTLQDAVTAAANEETTITYIASTKEEIAIQEGANITLDFAENVTLEGYIAPFNGNLTVNGGTINNANADYSAIEINSGNLTLTNVNISSARHAVRIDGGVEATIDGGNYTLNATSGTRHAVNVSGAANVTIKAGTFVGPNGTTMDSGSAVCVQAGATVTIEGGDFSGGKNATLGVSGTMTVKGGTFDQDPTTYVAQGYVVKYNETTSRYEVFLGVAKIDETGVIYGTLAEAISNATAGNTITLLANVTENVTVDRNLTINGDGKEYTGVMAGSAGKTITVNNVKFVDGRFAKDSKSSTGNYTFNNCTFIGNNTLPYALRFAGANTVTVEDCTVEDYQYSFLYVSSGTNTVNVKNVVVENCPNYAIYFASGVNNNMIENLTVRNSENGIVYNNTANRTLNLKGCTFENVETVINHAGNGTKNITSNFYGENNIGNKAFSQYAKLVLKEADATLVNAPEGLAISTTVEGCVVEYKEGETAGFGTYSVVPANVELVRGEESIGEFATIQDAIDAAIDGDVVKVLNNLTVTKDDAIKLGSYNTFFKVENKTVTIDLNGCDITGDVTGLGIAGKVGLVGLFSTNGAGHLTLEDSKGDAKVKIDNATETDPVYYLISSFDGNKGSITINGGSYSLNAAQDALIHSAGDECVTINGGNFYLGNIGTSDKGNGHPWIVNVNGSNSGNITINGGTFNDDMNHQAWDMEVYVPETLALQNNGDGTTWTVVESVAYVEEKGNLTNSAYHKVGYATLAEAFEATTIRNAKDNTITLVKEITLAESITVEAGQEVVLDLNGMTLTGKDNNTSGSFNLFVNRGTFEIKDSSAEGTGKITLEATTNRAWNASSSIVSNSAGTLTITSGTLEHLGGTDMAYGIDNNSTLGLTTLNVKGGKIASPYRAIRQFQNSLQDNIVVVDGGTISARAGIWMQQPSTNDKAQLGTLTINDGNFECVSNAVVIDICGGAQSNVTINGGTFSNTNENANLLLIWPLTDMNSVHENCSATMNITGGNFTCVGEGNLIGILDGADANGDVVLTGGTYSEDVNAYCAEGFAAVDNGNGTWTVMPTQEQSLLNGWNWYSTYLDITLNDLTTALGDNGISIKNINGTYVENIGNNLWLGQLNEINPSEMYLIETTAECDLKLAADLVNPNDHIISLNANWNWIGYPSNQEVAINVALANIPEPKEGDIIKSLNNGYAEYAFGLWLGTLNTMVPGVGYKYNNKSGEAKTFYYNIEATRGAVEANVTAENNYWTPNATKYPHNMTMTAVVDGLTNGNYEVAAFVNGEVRGSARPIYIEEIDAHIFFLTIHGEDVEEMSFRLYDIDTDTEYDLNDRINYSNDAHLGSVNEPYVFSRGTTGIGEAAMSQVNIYPNPTTTGSTINLQATCDKVEVYNALGVLVAEYQNVDSIDALETAGIYVIRITNDGNTQNCRLVVK